MQPKCPYCQIDLNKKKLIENENLKGEEPQGDELQIRKIPKDEEVK